MRSLNELDHRGDHLAFIQEVKGRVAADRHALTEPELKMWCARRFRNLFLTEAEADPNALAEASRGTSSGADARPPRQRLAERFLKVFGANDWQVEMPAPQIEPFRNTTLVFCPGLLNGMVPIGAFQSAFPVLERQMGLRILRADAHPVRGCDANMADLRSTIDRGLGQAADLLPITESTATPPKDIVLFGYSKGVADALTLLVHYPELKARVRCIVSWAGAVGGSYVANEIYEAVKDIYLPLGRIGEPMTKILKIVAPFIHLEGAIRRLDEFDIKSALHDLHTEKRAAFLQEHQAFFDGLSIPCFNLTGATTILDVPYFQATGVIQLNHYDTNNDMQLIQQHAKLPGPMSTDLAMFKANHWDMAYDAFPENRRLGSSNLEHPFPRKAAVTALFKLLGELGLID